MIVGTVNSSLEPTVRVTVRNATGSDHEIEAVVDTGFTGSLTLPTSVIAAFGLPWRIRHTVRLGDGSTDFYDVHAGIILWDGTVRHISVEAANTRPLLGMELISGCLLQIEAFPGGRVIIESLPGTGALP
jgi:clan AA aspartic protease